MLWTSSKLVCSVTVTMTVWLINTVHYNYLSYQYQIYFKVEGARICKVITDFCVTWESVFCVQPLLTLLRMIFDLIISFREKQAAMLSCSLAEVQRRREWEEQNLAREKQVCITVELFLCTSTHTFSMCEWRICPDRGLGGVYTPLSLGIVNQVCSGITWYGGKGGNSAPWKWLAPLEVALQSTPVLNPRLLKTLTGGSLWGWHQGYIFLHLFS